MIVFCLTAAHAYTIKGFLEGRGRELLPLCRVIAYGRLLRRRSLPRGTYVFADLERLSASEAEAAARIADALAAAGEGVRVLNHPTRSMRRYELLRALHAAGVNGFDVHRLAGGDPPRRYPVFIRAENDHGGAVTPLLRSAAELSAAAAAMEARSASREDKLVVEFCDVADAGGIVRKYGVFIVGGRIIPRHVWRSRRWCVKGPDIVDADSRREEDEFLRLNPHAALLADVARRARIDYGRLDYGLAGGRPQVWEINTNPCIVTGAWEAAGARGGTNALFAERMAGAIRELAGVGGRAGPAVRLPPSDRRGDGRGPLQALVNAALERLPLGAEVRLRAALHRLRRPASAQG